jgi:tRNA threonylcarbamoyladenosine biosynthesis protein TsaE
LRKFVTKSASGTKKIARALGRRLSPGDVVALRGALGAGKTTFAKGLVRALGVPERRVSSPTFVVIHEYQGRWPVYHLDWYRLARVGGADRELARECFEADAVTLVEWPERGADLLPRERIEVRLRHAGGSSRVIEVRTVGRKYANFGV